jgi:hypothetical protein
LPSITDSWGGKLTLAPARDAAAVAELFDTLATEVEEDSEEEETL